MRRDTILICAAALFLTTLYTGVAAPFDSLVAVALAQGGQTPPPTQTPPAPAPQPPGGGRGRSGQSFPAQQRKLADAALIERGGTLYGINCRLCHGADLRGGDMGGINLLRSAVALADTELETVRGVPRQQVDAKSLD